MPHSRGIPEPSEYGKFARRILRGYGRRIADADPEDLADLLALSHEVDAVIQATIDNGRERWDWSWEAIAKAAGVTRSAAFQRWGKPKGQTVPTDSQRAAAVTVHRSAIPGGWAAALDRERAAAGCDE
jgi:hypothetical protein